MVADVIVRAIRGNEDSEPVVGREYKYTDVVAQRAVVMLKAPTMREPMEKSISAWGDARVWCVLRVE